MSFKVVTHEFRPPIRGGDPICSVEFPVTLPTVNPDSGTAECSSGWNFCEDIETAFSIAGLWPNGWSAVVLDVTPSNDAIVRGKKHRASSLTINGLASDDLIRDAIERFSVVFGRFDDAMATEQWLWYEALRRPLRDAKKIEDGLLTALDKRELKWTLKQFDSTRAARDALDTWTALDAWAARDALDTWIALDARAARAALDARAAWAALDARAAWAALDARAAWAALDARAAWAALDALTVNFAARNGWVDYQPDLLSAGFRDACKHGLAIALPTGPNELGWTMVGDDERHPAVIA